MSARASLTTLDGVTTATELSAATSGAARTDAGTGSGTGRDLPVPAELATVLPWPGLRRGSTVAVSGSVSLLFALLSEATATGSWAAVVGLPGLGLTAAAESGIPVSRFIQVPRPGNDPLEVASALLDGVDLVVLAQTRQENDAQARRLSARARHRGSVLLVWGTWPAVDVSLDCTGARWHGLGHGHGFLREREITVRVSGRGAAARPRSCRLLLPSSGGAIDVAEGTDHSTASGASLRPVAG